MNLYFNEMSLSDDIDSNRRHIGLFARIWTRLKDETGCRHILSTSNIPEIVRKMGCSSSGRYNQLLFTVLRGPYIDHSDDAHTQEEADRFAKSQFWLLSPTSERLTLCDTLGWTVIKNSIFVGIPTTVFWENHSYRIEEIDQNLRSEQHRVQGITLLEHFEEVDIKDWIDLNFHATPEKTSIPREVKQTKFSSNHHGNNLLKDFAAKLVVSPYVVEVLNSISHMPHCNQLIGKKYPDGRMDVCLYWTPAHYSMCIQTTAKNKFQADLIAKELEERFGRR